MMFWFHPPPAAAPVATPTVHTMRNMDDQLVDMFVEALETGPADGEAAIQRFLLLLAQSDNWALLPNDAAAYTARCAARRCQKACVDHWGKGTRSDAFSRTHFTQRVAWLRRPPLQTLAFMAASTAVDAELEPVPPVVTMKEVDMLESLRLRHVSDRGIVVSAALAPGGILQDRSEDVGKQGGHPLPLCLAGNDRLVVVSSKHRGKLIAYNLEFGRIASVCATMSGHTDYIFDLVTFDEHRVASCSKDGTIRVWDVDTGALVQVWHHSWEVMRVMTVEKGKQVASLSHVDGQVRVWTIGEEEPRLVLHRAGVKAVSIAVGLAGKEEIIVGFRSGIGIYDLHQGDLKRFIEITGPIECVAAHRGVLLALSPRHLTVLDAWPGGVLQATDPVSSDRFPAYYERRIVALSPNLIGLPSDRYWRVFDLASRTMLSRSRSIGVYVERITAQAPAWFYMTEEERRAAQQQGDLFCGCVIS